MKFRNYCILVMGVIDSDAIKLEIEKVTDSKINVLDARGILIATFTSGVSPKELSDWFRLNKRNFFLFDLDEENSGFYIAKQEIHKGLFGFLDEMTDQTLQDRASEFLKDIKVSEPIDIKGYSRPLRRELRKEVKPKQLTKEEVEKMTIKEKQELQDKIIDNGVENMTEYDKEILSFLWI
jgi:hypothetical protein